jgi:hypothetical protein
MRAASECTPQDEEEADTLRRLAGRNRGGNGESATGGGSGLQGGGGVRSGGKQWQRLAAAAYGPYPSTEPGPRVRLVAFLTCFRVF